MPHRGRPLGTSERRRREAWEWEQQRRQWEEQRRFEEVPTDEEDDSEIGWEVDSRSRRSAGDELYFTGVDPSTGSPSSRQLVRRGSFTPSDDTGSEDDHGDTRGALRHKERALVLTARERIRRAQIRGQPVVRLTESELDALERDRQRLSYSETSTDRRLGSRGSDSSRHSHELSSRGSNFHHATVPRTGSSRPASKAIYDPENSPYIPITSPSGYAEAGPSDPSIYPPLQYAGPRRKRSSKSISLSHSGSPRPHHTNPPTQLSPHPKQVRYSSLPEHGHYPSGGSSSARSSPTLLRSELHYDRTPRARSKSVAQPGTTVDPFQYQIHPPQSPQLHQVQAQPRRPGSSTPEVQYGSLRRRPPSAAYPADPRTMASSSDPSLGRHWRAPVESESIASSDMDVEASDEEYEVAVREVPLRPEGRAVDVPLRYPGRRRA